MFVNHRICVVLQSSVCHIDDQNHPKFMHKSKHILVTSYLYVLTSLGATLTIKPPPMYINSTLFSAIDKIVTINPIINSHSI